MGLENENMPWHLSEPWDTGYNLKRRPEETTEARIKRLTGTFPDYDPMHDPFTPSYKPHLGHGPFGYDHSDEKRHQISWLNQHGDEFIVFPGDERLKVIYAREIGYTPPTMCMSWVWPWWWGEPEVSYSYDPYVSSLIMVKGRVARKLQFQSGLELYQLMAPVHGYDEPGATLFDPKDSHKLKRLQQQKENEHE